MSNLDGCETVYCRDCGAVIRRAAEICPECGVRQRPAPNAGYDGGILDGRNPLVAAVLSALFPGLGHVYARDVRRGMFFTVSFVLAVLSVVVVVGLVLAPSIWLYAAYDAAKTAQHRDQQLLGLSTPV